MSADAAPVGSHPPWRQIKAELEARGFRPARALGQNFLIDDNMLRAIARDAQLERGDFVLEIGPGCGVLTLQLLALGAELVAVEIDARLLEVARLTLGPQAAVHWIAGDALAGKHRLAPELVRALPTERDWHLVSNLPYSAGTPILVCAARLPHPPRSMTVLVQEDLARRFIAEAGSRARGAVTARLEASYRATRVRTVPAGLFWPRPQVESAVVRFELRDDRPRGAELVEFDRLVGTLFEQRRKTLLQRLAAHLGDRERAGRVADRLGLERRARAEDLSRAELLALARSLAAEH